MVVGYMQSISVLVISRRALLAPLVVLLAALIPTNDAFAALFVVAQERGRITLSVDGVGTRRMRPAPVEVEKPSDEATVRSAYYACAAVRGDTVTPGNVVLAGTPIAWDLDFQRDEFNNVFADITDQVAGNINARPAGRFTLFHQERDPFEIDGCGLFVIFDDPTQVADSTAFVLFGGQELDGDSFSIALAEPIGVDEQARFGLAISFSQQDGALAPAGSRLCGAFEAQFSTVDVNGERLTSCAGNLDDASPQELVQNGNLITVGGIGDSLANPGAPFQTPGDGSEPRVQEDELYDLSSFLGPEDLTVRVDTLNPSNDDNIFGAYFFVAAPAVLGEGVVLAPVAATNLIDTPIESIARLQNTDGLPLADAQVTFEVVAGPNTGLAGTTNSDSAGEARFSYASATEGADTVVARFIGSEGTPLESNQAQTRWVPEPIPCQVDEDGDVDLRDVQQVFLARGQSAQGNADPRDADGDGFISFGDVRTCVLACDLPGCEIGP